MRRSGTVRAYNLVNFIVCDCSMISNTLYGLYELYVFRGGGGSQAKMNIGGGKNNIYI
jgi:hypothetical protein